MQREQLIGLIEKLPEDADVSKLEENVTELYHSLPGEVLAWILQGPSTPLDEPAPKKRTRKAKANGAAKPKKAASGEYDKKVFAAVKRRKNGISMGDLAEMFSDMSKAQLRTQLGKMPLTKTGNKRSTLYHAK